MDGKLTRANTGVMPNIARVKTKQNQAQQVQKQKMNIGKF